MRGRYYIGCIEEIGGKTANMAMDVPLEDYEKELQRPGMTLTVKNLNQKW